MQMSWNEKNAVSMRHRVAQQGSVSLKNDDDDLLVQKLFKIEQNHELGKQLLLRYILIGNRWSG